MGSSVSRTGGRHEAEQLERGENQSSLEVA